MKNILYISTTSQIGGGPEHLYSLIRGIDRSKFDLKVAAPDNGEYFEKFGEYADTIALNKISDLPGNLEMLQRVIRNDHIDIIHSHGRGAGIYSRILKIKNPDIKVVHTFHGIYYEENRTLARNLRIRSDQFLRKYTDAFICVSKKERDDAVANAFAVPDKTKVIYNGVDSSRFDIKIDAGCMRQTIGITESDFVIGYVARLARTKGHRELIEAFTEFSKECKNARLLLVGEGEEKETLESMAKERAVDSKILFLGKREDVPQLLKCMDMFVSSSHKEGMPYNVLEALAAGVPTIATDVTGNSEIITNNKNGILCSPCDPEDLHRAIKAMRDADDKTKAFFISNGKKDIEEKFSVRKMVSETQNVYERLLYKGNSDSEL